MSKVYLVDRTDTHAMSAMEKVVQKARPNAVIPLSADEFAAITSMKGICVLEIPDIEPEPVFEPIDCTDLDLPF